ncbi:hypothetical protein ACFY8W_11455 [Streptomyces sp. NPDC012637]|uniref:hypothetical protein n=1 Tax=Streptomyces sp. NPDC012637 TaxID=3364842 RepID=UPI0036EFBB4F
MPRSPGTYFPGGGTLAEETYLEGKAHGVSDSVLRVFAVRGVMLPDAVAEHIHDCTDPETLRWWLDHAATTGRPDGAVTTETEAREVPPAPTAPDSPEAPPAPSGESLPQ